MGDCGERWPIRERLSRALIPWGGVLSGWSRGLRRPGATATALLVAAYGLAQVGKSNDFPRQSLWQAQHAGWWAFSVLAVLATIASLLVVLGYRALLGDRRASERLGKVARGTVRMIEKNTNLNHDEIGVNIWKVQGPWGFRRLERVAQALAEDRPTTPILWTKGKGVIGTSWMQNGSLFVDMHQLHLDFTEKEDFCGLPRTERFYFSWQEFRETERYKAVLAVPLRAGSHGRYPVRGVLAIDVMADDKRPELKGIESNREFGAIIRTCEAVLSGVDE